MAGGRTWRQYVEARTNGQPQWSPGLMAGGSWELRGDPTSHRGAAMEPRPDGRGKTRADR